MLENVLVNEGVLRPCGIAHRAPDRVRQDGCRREPFVIGERGLLEPGDLSSKAGATGSAESAVQDFVAVAVLPRKGKGQEFDCVFFALLVVCAVRFEL
jgi:hypothetical protein